MKTCDQKKKLDELEKELFTKNKKLTKDNFLKIQSKVKSREAITSLSNKIRAKRDDRLDNLANIGSSELSDVGYGNSHDNINSSAGNANKWANVNESRCCSELDSKEFIDSNKQFDDIADLSKDIMLENEEYRYINNTSNNNSNIVISDSCEDELNTGIRTFSKERQGQPTDDPLYADDIHKSDCYAKYNRSLRRIEKLESDNDRLTTEFDKKIEQERLQNRLLKAKLANADEKLISQDKLIKVLEDRISSLIDDKKNQMMMIRMLNDKINACELEKSNLEGRLAAEKSLHKRSVTDLNSVISDQKNKIDDLTSKNIDTTRALLASQKSLQTLQEKFSALKSELEFDRTEKSGIIKQLTDERDQLKDLLSATTRQISELEADNNAYQTSIYESEVELQRQKLQIAELENKLLVNNGVARELKLAREEITQLSSLKNKFKVDNKILAQKQKQLESTIESYKQQNSALAHENSQISNKLYELQKFIETSNCTIPTVSQPRNAVFTPSKETLTMSHIDHGTGSKCHISQAYNSKQKLDFSKLVSKPGWWYEVSRDELTSLGNIPSVAPFINDLRNKNTHDLCGNNGNNTGKCCSELLKSCKNNELCTDNQLGASKDYLSGDNCEDVEGSITDANSVELTALNDQLMSDQLEVQLLKDRIGELDANVKV